MTVGLPSAGLRQLDHRAPFLERKKRYIAGKREIFLTSCKNYLYVYLFVSLNNKKLNMLFNLFRYPDVEAIACRCR